MSPDNDPVNRAPDPADFDFELPPELIAQAPLAERAASRLLVVPPAAEAAAGQCVYQELRFAELERVLRPDDLLIMNNTRVIPARLFGRKASGGRVELLLERVLSDDTALVQLRSSRAPRPGTRLEFEPDIDAEVLGRDGSFFRLRFAGAVLELLEQHGRIPLPPYIERDAGAADRDRYQTVYASDPGAVAAPTAGLHFDADLLGRLRAAGVTTAEVTLHVGAGTFLPLRDAQLESGRLHAERLTVSAEVVAAVAAARAAGGRVVAVGTTVMRALESAAAQGELVPLQGETELFIWPGYQFRVVDALITNFHLPQSSLLMLVGAFAGTEHVLAAYRHAVRERFRFFSYGDAMLLHLAPEARQK